MKKVVFLIMVFTVLLHAESFRCGSHIIEKGMSKYSIVEKCGEPLFSEKVGEIFDPNGAGVEKIYIYEHVYKCDGERYILTFHGTKLVKIVRDRKL